jgi:hypothetical protein
MGRLDGKTIEGAGLSGLAETLVAVAYGVRIGCRSNDAEVLDRMRARLPFGWKPSRSEHVDRLYALDVRNTPPRAKRRRTHTLYRDGERLARSSDLERLLDDLERDVRLHVAEMARNRVFVHAGVVAWNGQAIVMPGSSFTGKSTLTAALVRAGALYYSDEYAVLDRSGRVHPFAQPLQLRLPGSYEQQDHPVESIGGRAGRKPCPVGLVLATRYRAGAAFRPRQISQARGMMELLAHAVSARRSPETVIGTLKHIVETAPVIKGVRGEADDMLGLLVRQLCRDTR